MIAPARAAFMKGAAPRAKRKAPSTLTERQRRKPSGGCSSRSAVGPAIPALAQSTSSPFHSAPSRAKRSSTALSSVTSRQSRLQPAGQLSSTAGSLSTTHTFAPAAAKASPIARPMPLPPAVISTRCMPCRVSFPFDRIGPLLSARQPALDRRQRVHQREVRVVLPALHIIRNRVDEVVEGRTDEPAIVADDRSDLPVQLPALVDVEIGRAHV